ncbi:unnamed protein product [Lampetra planeri]
MRDPAWLRSYQTTCTPAQLTAPAFCSSMAGGRRAFPQMRLLLPSSSALRVAAATAAAAAAALLHGCAASAQVPWLVPLAILREAPAELLLVAVCAVSSCDASSPDDGVHRAETSRPAAGGWAALEVEPQTSSVQQQPAGSSSSLQQQQPAGSSSLQAVNPRCQQLHKDLRSSTLEL